MSRDSVWIAGPTRSGKTARLIEQFCHQAKAAAAGSRQTAAFLVFAAIGDNRLDLVDRLASATGGQYRFDSATPLGFFQDEVLLFFPLLAQRLHLQTPFPVRLRPETEQELATRLWRPEIEAGRLRQEGVRDYYMVRRTLDLLQLAAAGGVPHEEIPLILQAGIAEQEGSPELWSCMGEALERWWHWCLNRGLLTYGILTELYWRYLLPHPTYQQHLKQRYRAILADDVDEYPAIARSLFEFFLDQDIPAAFTFNPNGAIRLGLGADPDHLAGLAERCRVETLAPPVEANLGSLWGAALVQWLQAPMQLPQLPAAIRTIAATARAQLLRETAETIATAIHTGEVQPQDVAVIVPGLDAIARYTLREILTSRGIPVRVLNDQHPLTSAAMVRALLTLLALVYPGLGRLLNREAIAEMLVVLSQTPLSGLDSTGGPRATIPNASPRFAPLIDPVRAGLLTDHCFAPDPDRPRLLPVTVFPRWDRLGYQATRAYGEMVQWIEAQQLQQQQHLLPSPVALLDRAIQKFLYGGSHLPYDQLAVLRELMETAQHYWAVDARLRQHSPSPAAASVTVGQFIQLLRDGTITADPFPVRPLGKARQTVVLSTIYQYRSDRRSHRWQFWLDASSSSWLTGGGFLFGAPLMLRQWSLGRQWTAEAILEADQRRLQRQVLDLLCRATERVYLCHSDLATNGQEQAGALLSLVNAAIPVPADTGR